MPRPLRSPIQNMGRDTSIKRVCSQAAIITGEGNTAEKGKRRYWPQASLLQSQKRGFLPLPKKRIKISWWIQYGSCFIILDCIKNCMHLHICCPSKLESSWACPQDVDILSNQKDRIRLLDIWRNFLLSHVPATWPCIQSHVLTSTWNKKYLQIKESSEEILGKTIFIPLLKLICLNSSVCNYSSCIKSKLESKWSVRERCITMHFSLSHSLVPFWSQKNNFSFSQFWTKLKLIKLNDGRALLWNIAGGDRKGQREVRFILFYKTEIGISSRIQYYLLSQRERDELSYTEDKRFPFVQSKMHFWQPSSFGEIWFSSNNFQKAMKQNYNSLKLQIAIHWFEILDDF